MNKKQGRITKFFIILGILFFFFNSYSESAAEKLMVIAESAPVHLMPDANSTKIRSVTKGTLLNYKGGPPVHGKWYYVYNASEKNTTVGGYILSDCVERCAGTTIEDKFENNQQIREKSQTGGNKHLKIGISYFQPSGESIKNSYGSRPDLSGNFSLGIWRGLEIWVEGNYSWDRGELSFTEEETKLYVYPMGGGINYRIYAKNFSFYAGAGLLYFLFKEDNPIGSVSEGQLGVIGKVGGCFYFYRGMFIDVFFGYSYAKETSTDIKVNIGGLEFGSSLGFRF